MKFYLFHLMAPLGPLPFKAQQYDDNSSSAFANISLWEQSLSRREIQFISAVRANEVEDVKYVLLEGVDPNVQNEYGMTPLHYSSMKGFLEITDLLLRYNASVTATSNMGFTPLHGAALYGHVEIVVLLLRGGADITAGYKDRYGRTALDNAEKNGHRIIIELLKPYSKIDFTSYFNLAGALPCILVVMSALAALVYTVNAMKTRNYSGGQRAKYMSMAGYKKKQKKK